MSMITVRFPTGFSVQYNTAIQAIYKSDGRTELRDSKGDWVATAPSGALVEVVSPCRTYNPVATDSDRVQASVELLAKEIRSLKRKVGK